MFSIDIDADGVTTIIIDQPGRRMNVIDDAFIAEFDTVVDQIVEDEAIKGVIFTSGKPSFLAGADLMSVEKLAREAVTGRASPPDVRGQNRIQRKLETCKKPVVAAINGTALGGGFELCLTCHYRIVANDESIQLGLPEVTVGLLPGGGGTQRLPRLIGIEQALPFLLQGTALSPSSALAAGMVDEVVDKDDLLTRAKAWILTHPKVSQPWDTPGFRFPGGGNYSQNPALSMVFTDHIGLIQRQGNRNFPAPSAILSCVYEGSALPIDRALEVESQYFSKLFASPVAANVIRTNFISRGKLNKLMHRPEGIERSQVKELGVLGAGMMGAGIAYVSAVAGMKVILLDQSQDFADKGKLYSTRLLDAAVTRGTMTQKQRDEILDRIVPTASFDDLADCDFIVEAVYEDRHVKSDATRKTAAVAKGLDVFGTNTSTLPISGLAEAYPYQEKFIGIHFFSPVERMALVEIIKGDKTSDETLARAFDYVRQIGKTPILVSDQRGFYTSRVFGTYLDEGMKMVLEGVNPALIENAGRRSGMPVGPLTLQDEVSFELSYTVRNQTRDDLAEEYVPKMAEPIIDLFFEKLERLGKKNNKGFYDYQPDGSKTLWDGLSEHFPVASEQPEIEEIAKRFLYIQAIETVRCLEEGVLFDPIDGDVGAVLGWSFASHTGGPISMIETIGVETFMRECQRLEQTYGSRFRPPELLVKMADEGQTFYDAA